MKNEDEWFIQHAREILDARTMGGAYEGKTTVTSAKITGTGITYQNETPEHLPGH